MRCPTDIFKEVPQGCPCGYLGDPRHACTCPSTAVDRYRSRISGPLLDRIDIQIQVPAVRYQDLSSDTSGAPSADIRSRVETTRRMQRDRFAGLPVYCNAQMSSRLLQKFCGLEPSGRSLLETAMERLGLSARGYARILKIARTIADMEASERIQAAHLAEAIQYRSLDRRSR